MEQNLPIVAKKVQSLVRTILFMIKKKISKSKLLLDLNIMMKRGNLTGKPLHYHNHHSTNFTFPSPPIKDYYEFSCSNTPINPLSLFTTLKKHHIDKKTSKNKSVNINESHDQIFVDPSVIKALEMLTNTSPAVRQLRVTDSPFPLTNGEDDGYVDEAAEKFIMKFYSDLRRQG
ncbi:uncharacterized protein LOC143588632 [Bidens hawaiensis]|uniref:uncharacterized protein LOC143588632 n=1 Tax=Bidens hawaiensis TaxID=980011 RepID=UPI0040492CA4